LFPKASNRDLKEKRFFSLGGEKKDEQENKKGSNHRTCKREKEIKRRRYKSARLRKGGKPLLWEVLAPLPKTPMALFEEDALKQWLLKREKNVFP